MVGEETTRVSDHVWAIMGFPNIAIVVGARATLVVDTGLGPKNGATAAKVAQKLAPTNRLYLTTTHFHPEHAGGEPGFPPQTLLIRDAEQQREMGVHGQEMMDFFRNMSARNNDLLANVELRPPDISFEKEAMVDLGGGVRARLLWLGGAHTNGDELTLVEPDRTLISGDVVQNKVVPNVRGDACTPATWLAVLDRVAELKPVRILPDHSAPGDASLIAAEAELIREIEARGLALKRQGMSIEEASKQVTAELKTEHPDWANTDTSRIMPSVYGETK
jgi:glyoxylase-like metal-dependent hydrolase (beta-lactamase superfamily II)